ncbi:MAG: membrane protein insertase YidC [Aestuariivirgaceae bacterium]
MKEDNRNFILAIVLSMLIILGWNYFYAQPMLEKQRQQVEQTHKLPPQLPGQPVPGQPVPQPGAQGQAVPSVGEPSATPAPGVPQPREAVLEQAPRLPIRTPSVEGSINLKGGVLDDLRLTRYHETVDPKSPTIVLLSPSGSVNGFFTEHGFSQAPGGTAKLPGRDTVWTVPPDAALEPGKPVTLTFDNGQGLIFRRTFSVDQQYMFTLRQEVENRTGAPVSLFPYARVQRQGTPHVQGVYVLHEGLLGVLGGSLKEITYAHMKDQPDPDATPSQGGWLGITDKYWAVALVPDQTAEIVGTFRHSLNGALDVYQADYLNKAPITVAPGSTGASESRVFAGAKVVETITDYGKALNIDRFDLLIDWGWFYFITKPMFWALHAIKGWVGNFGLAILIVTVLLKLIFFPLANKSYEAMSKMKKLQPEMESIKQRFADDRMKQQEAMMELYKREKVNPLAGCLPVLVQIPVFFALYKVLYVTIEMRHAPFYGWIRDLSAPDPTSLFNLFGLIPWTPPHLLMIGVLPIIMGITMWVQMKLNPPPPDPIQAQIFNYMPLIFTVMLASFPAGLVIYWAWNNLLSILQQALIMRKNGVPIDLLGNIRDSVPFLKRKGESRSGA